MNYLPLVLCGLLGLVTTLVLIPIIRRRAAARTVDAGASLHHTHRAPVSRLGGVALAAAFVLVSLVAFIFFPVGELRTQTRLVIALSSLAMFILGLLDDLRPLGAKKKLLGQIIIASVVCALGVSIEKFQSPLTLEFLNVQAGEVYELGAWGWVFTVLWLVALTNMINLIDGIDGLAGGIALMMMGLLVFVGAGGELLYPILVAAGMFGALLGFLRYNFPPAKIYMGDGGAYFLGFLIAILTLVHSQKGTIVAALIAPLFALALPIVDVSVAILRRGLKGLPIFRPDRKHIHHRLQEIGLSRTRTVLILYGISSVFLLMAFGVFWSKGQLVPILFGFMCLTLILSARSFNFSRDWFAVGRVLENSLELRKETHYALALGRWLEMEAERADDFDSLWNDYTFTLKKLGFAAATFTSPQNTRAWLSDTITHGDLRQRHEFLLDGPVSIEFAGDSHIMAERTFFHLSELAAESWMKAANRFRATNSPALPAPSAPA